MTIAVYPGTFDPITSGHEDLVRRAAGLFDEIVVAVADSRAKGTLFSYEERLQIARDVMQPFANVRVEGFSGLLAEFVNRVGGRVVVRGLRSVADFEYEFRMAGMNHYLMPAVGRLVLTPAEHYEFLAPSLVRGISRLGWDGAAFVPAAVRRALEAEGQRTDA